MLVAASISLLASFFFSVCVLHFVGSSASDPEDKGKARVLSVLSMVLAFLAAFFAFMSGASYGQYQLLSNPALKQGVTYEVIGEPALYKPAGRALFMNYVFLSQNGNDPVAYRLTGSAPPPRFIVITNGKGQAERLPRPFSEEKEKQESQ